MGVQNTIAKLKAYFDTWHTDGIHETINEKLKNLEDRIDEISGEKIDGIQGILTKGDIHNIPNAWGKWSLLVQIAQRLKWFEQFMGLDNDANYNNIIERNDVTSNYRLSTIKNNINNCVTKSEITHRDTIMNIGFDNGREVEANLAGSNVHYIQRPAGSDTNTYRGFGQFKLEINPIIRMALLKLEFYYYLEEGFEGKFHDLQLSGNSQVLPMEYRPIQAVKSPVSPDITLAVLHSQGDRNYPLIQVRCDGPVKQWKLVVGSLYWFY